MSMVTLALTTILAAGAGELPAAPAAKWAAPGGAEWAAAGEAERGRLVGIAEPALFHTQLDHTLPADGDTLDVAPGEMELVFTGPVEGTGTRLTLLGPGGSSLSLEPTVEPEGRTIVTAGLPPLDAGAYRVEWRVVSADGHPVEGSFVFFVRAGPGETVPGGEGEATAEGSGEPVDSLSEEAALDGEAFVPPPSDDEGPSGAEISSIPILVTGAAVNLTLLTLAGLLALTAWGPGVSTATTRRTGLVLAVAAFLSAPLYAWLWAGQALGSEAGMGARLEGLVALTSGRAVALRVGLVVLVLWAVALARRTGLAAALAVLAVAVGSLGGHAAGMSPSLAAPANAVHLLAVSGWVGGLAYVITQRSSPDHTDAVLGVSTVALVCAVLVALTGLGQSWLFLDSLSALLDSTYGRLIVLKAAGLAILVAFGAYNRFSLIPRMEERGDTTGLTRSVRLELAVAGAVLAVASILAHVPPGAS